MALVPAPRPQRERRDAREHRQQIHEAAVRLFVERGVESVTMDEIAQAAGVGKGTLYRRYADKGALVMALMGACVGTLHSDMEDVLAGAQGSALTQLEAVLARLADWIEEHTAELGVISDQAAGERRGAVYCSPLYQWIHGVVEELLDRAAASGEVTIADRVYVADALLAALDIDLYLFQRRHRGYSPTQVRAGVLSLVRGLRRA